MLNLFNFHFSLLAITHYKLGKTCHNCHLFFAERDFIISYYMLLSYDTIQQF